VLERVFFHYGQRFVLENINLTVWPGDFLGIVGPNGSGKSTLLKIILRLLRPSSGQIQIFGLEQEKFRQWPKIGYIPQSTPALYRGFPATVQEMVLSGLTASLGLFKRPGAEENNRVTKALEQVGVADLRKRIIGELSGGQQQRVLIAKALVSRPSLLILDEPTVGVDVAAQEQFYDLLAELRQEDGMTLILVSHDVGVVTEHVSSVACLNRKLYFHGAPADFWSQDSLCQTYGSAVRVLRHAH